MTDGIPGFAILPRPVLAALPGLSGSAMKVAVALAAHMNEEGVCWPSRDRLSAASGVKDSHTIARSLKELERAGLLRISRGRGRTLYSWLSPVAPSTEPGNEADAEEPDTEAPTSVNSSHPAPVACVKVSHVSTAGCVKFSHQDVGSFHTQNINHEQILSSRSRARRSDNEKTADRRDGTYGPSFDGASVWSAWAEARRKRGLREPVRDGPDLTAARRLAENLARGEMTPDELRWAMGAYLADRDPFIVSNGHALRHLNGGRIARYLDERLKEEERHRESVRATRARLAEARRAAPGEDWDPMVFRNALALGLGIAPRDEDTAAATCAPGRPAPAPP